MTISLKKTIVMHRPAPGKPYVPTSIYVKGKKLEVFDTFVHRGSALSRSNTLDEEIRARLSKACNAFGKHEKRLWSQSDIRVSTKIKVYRACVVTVFLYGCETWTTYRRHIKRLERFHQQFLRLNLKISWRAHVPDTEVLQEDTRMPKQVLFGELRQGKRPECKPKQRYKDCLKDTLKKVRIDINTWEDLAKDRGKWRKVFVNRVKDFEERSRRYAEAKGASKYMEEVTPHPG